MMVDFSHTVARQFALYMFLFLALLFTTGKECGASFIDEPFINDITIHVSAEYRDAAMLERMARDLLFLKPGERFSQAALEHSLSALRLSNRFSHVEVDSREAEGIFELIFHLTPAVLVRDIRMSGIYPFFERDIRNAMTLAPGDTVTDAVLEEQRLLVEDFYRRERSSRRLPLAQVYRHQGLLLSP